MLLSDGRHAMFALSNLNFVSIERTLLTFRRDCWACHRPKNIRIHLAISRVRFYLLRFNSSGNFCEGGAICSRETPYPVLVPQGFRGTLADDDAGSHGIAGGHARHDRAVCNAKVFDPIDLKLTVYD